ncbi:MAG: YncE family protein, partial [Thermoanaerobaculia bacterium]
DDVASPSAGYLWDLALKKKITLRDYGEFVIAAPDGKTFLTTRDALREHVNLDFPPFDMNIPDQRRADVWLADFRQFVDRGEMPALQIVRLPNDHTAGGKAGAPTPRACMADNDLALGRMIEALSRSPFWKDTVVFVVEDDAQAGPDHVDSHRSVLLVVSAHNHGGVIHRFVNTTDVIATIEEILGLDSMSQFDHYGRPLREVFADAADLRPYDPLRPAIDLNEKNPPDTDAARQSMLLDFSRADVADDELFNRILWRVIKGDRPMPAPMRVPAGALGE